MITFWPTHEAECSIQVHTKEEHAFVSKLDTARRIAYAVLGSPLEVWRVSYSLPWVRRKCQEAFPDALEVDGGDWSLFFESGQKIRPTP